MFLFASGTILAGIRCTLSLSCMCVSLRVMKEYPPLCPPMLPLAEEDEEDDDPKIISFELDTVDRTISTNHHVSSLFRDLIKLNILKEKTLVYFEWHALMLPLSLKHY